MKKMTQTLFVPWLATLMLGALNPVSAGEPFGTQPRCPLEKPGGKGFHPGRGGAGETREHTSYGDIVLRHMDELKLSDEQIGKIARLHQSNQQKVREIGQRLHESRDSAYRQFLDPASDEATIRQTAKSHTQAFDEMLETTLKTRQAINAVLSPEQVSKLALMKSKP